ncbi:hypothetical protein Tco_0353185 [Tanacetum coccineum]
MLAKSKSLNLEGISGTYWAEVTYNSFDGANVLCKFVLTDHKSSTFSEDEKPHAKVLKIRCNLNNVACKLKLREYKQAVKLCTKITKFIIAGANHLIDPEANEVTSIVSYFLELPAIDKYLYCWKAAGFTADPLGSSALWTLQIRLDLMLHGCFRVLMYK